MGGGGEQIVRNRYTENLTTKTMKHTTITTMAALLLGCTGLYAQGGAATVAYTKPAGFVTHTLKAGKLNLIGLTLHSPIAISGSFDTVSGTTLTDNDVNFTSVLDPNKTYILEIIENAAGSPANPSPVGMILEIAPGSWESHTLTTSDNLASFGLAGETTPGANNGAKYQLRAAKTLRDVFGANNEAGLQEGASVSADIVWISKSNGNDYDKYYYHPGGTFPVVVSEGWKELSGADAPAEIPIIYTDSVFVERRGTTDLPLVVTGSVVTQSVVVPVPGKYTFISSVFPVGSTLANSSLESSMQKGSSGSADLLWIPKDTEDFNEKISFDKYYYHPGGTFPVVVSPGWKLLGGDLSVDVSDTPLKSGMIIERRADQPYNAKITPPVHYGNL